MKVIILALGVIFFSQLAIAQNYYGIGASSCDGFLSSNEFSKINYFTWAQGYISAYSINNNFNFSANGEFANTKLQMEYIETYCRANPLKSYSDAVERLITKSVISGPNNLFSNKGSKK